MLHTQNAQEKGVTRKMMLNGALLALVVALTASPAGAHPGNVAADGCHYCRTNCTKWGEVEGERHCHGDRQRARPRRNVQQPPAQPPQAAQDRIRKIPIEIRGSAPRIIDADTLEVAGQRVRLQGIDAPEAAQACRQANGQRYRCGERATEALRARIRRGSRDLYDCGPGPLQPGARHLLRGGWDRPEWLVGPAGLRSGLSALFDHVCARGNPGPGRPRRPLGGRVRGAVGVAARPAAGLNLDIVVLLGRSGLLNKSLKPAILPEGGEGAVMTKEDQWVKKIFIEDNFIEDKKIEKAVQARAGNKNLAVGVGQRLLYAYQARRYKEQRPQSQESKYYQTDVLVSEKVSDTDQEWTPRVIIEAKLGIHTHGAITYSQKAADQKAFTRICVMECCWGTLNAYRGGSFSTDFTSIL